MNCKFSKRLLISTLLVMTAGIVFASPSFAAVVDLKAEARPVTMPDGTSIMMWGFFDTADTGTDWTPGPVLDLLEGDSLTINLTNNLAVPVSIVIPGQSAVLVPARNAEGRVTSFTQETLPGAVQAYNWTGLKAGTYLYHSGTHPAVQVQMGLYGAAVVDSAAAEAYPGIPYDNEVILLYSEVDPDLHASVAAAVDAGNPPAASIYYKPEYFLVNGMPHPAAIPILGHPISTGEQVLIRLVNAGLETHVPGVQGAYVSIIAEDGNLYQFAREQYSVLLPAGKTKDVLWNPVAAGSYAAYDRRLYLTSGGALGGGMLVYLDVAGNNPPSITSTPVTAATEGVLYSYQVVVVDPDAGDVLTYSLDVAPSLMTISTTGLIEWTPGLADIGDHPVIVRVTDAGGAFDIQSFTISVSPGAANHPPMIVSAPVTTATTGLLYSYDVVASDPDLPGDTLTFSLDPTPPVGMTITPVDAVTARIEWTPLATGDYPVTVRVTDLGGLFYTQAFTITVSAPVNIPPVAVDDFASTQRNVPVFINLIANDYDPDGTIDPNSIMITSSLPNPDGTYTTSRGGTVSVLSMGVIYTPKRNFRGTDIFTYTVNDNLGATSNEATVRVNVLR